MQQVRCATCSDACRSETRPGVAPRNISSRSLRLLRPSPSCRLRARCLPSPPRPPLAQDAPTAPPDAGADARPAATAHGRRRAAPTCPITKGRTIIGFTPRPARSARSSGFPSSWRQPRLDRPDPQHARADLGRSRPGRSACSTSTAIASTRSTTRASARSASSTPRSSSAAMSASARPA